MFVNNPAKRGSNYRKGAFEKVRRDEIINVGLSLGFGRKSLFTITKERAG